MTKIIFAALLIVLAVIGCDSPTGDHDVMLLEGSFVRIGNVDDHRAQLLISDALLNDEEYADTAIISLLTGGEITQNGTEVDYHDLQIGTYLRADIVGGCFDSLPPKCGSMRVRAVD